jgi:hypothetical protein
MKQPVRKGIDPVARPTEWITAVVMLSAAVTAFQTDHDLAALLSVAGACLPVIITAVVAKYEASHADTVVETPAVEE